GERHRRPPDTGGHRRHDERAARGCRPARRAPPRGAREGGRSQNRRRRGAAAAGAVAGGGITHPNTSRFAPRGHLRVAPFSLWSYVMFITELCHVAAGKFRHCFQWDVFCQSTNLSAPWRAAPATSCLSSKLQAITKFLRRRNRTPQKAIL